MAALAVDEQQQVDQWRVERFLTVTDGRITLLDAMELAQSDADPHDLDSLLRHGCPLQVALDIVG